MFELIDKPARINRYKDAGYTREEASRLANVDMQDAASDIIKADLVDPVSVEITELGPVPVMTDDLESDKLESATELEAVVGACRAHGMGMSDLHYRLASAIQNNLTGAIVTDKRMIKMEAVHALNYDDKELIIHFEDTVGQTIKNIWEKVRNSFINTFNRIRTWYIKAFDSSQRLGNKAKAVRTQAENKQGVVNQQTFQMGGLKTLAIGRRAPDQSAFVNIIGKMSEVTRDMMAVNAEHYNKLTEKMTDALKELIKNVEASAPQSTAPASNTPAGQGGNSTPNTTTPSSSNQQADYNFNGANPILTKMAQDVEALKANYGKTLEEWNDAASDERFKDNASNQNIPVKFYRLNNLPGDKMCVVSIPDTSGVNSAQSLNDLRSAFGGTVEPINPKQTELEDSGTFKTLSTAQVTSICDSVMTGCKAGLDYKLLFAQRDKAFKNLGTQLDQTVNQADKLENKALTFVKGNVTAATSIFGKINNIEGKWFKYAMTVFSKSIDYCQGSLNQTT